MFPRRSDLFLTHLADRLYGQIDVALNHVYVLNLRVEFLIQFINPGEPLIDSVDFVA